MSDPAEISQGTILEDSEDRIRWRGVVEASEAGTLKVDRRRRILIEICHFLSSLVNNFLPF